MKMNSKFFFLLIGRVAQVLLAVASIRLMTEFLDQKEVGHQYLINSMILWFSMVLINPVGMYVNRHVHQWTKNREFYGFIRQLNIYFISIGILSVPVLFATQMALGIGQELPLVWSLAYVFLFIFFSTWFQTLVSFFNLFDFQKHFVSLNILSQTMGLFFAVFFVRVISNSAFSWLFGILMGQILSLVVATVFFRMKFEKDAVETSLEGSTVIFAKKWNFFSKETFHFCYPIAITTLFMWFMNQGYRIYIEKILGAESLASIGVGLGLAASLASVVETMTTQFFYPGYYAALAGSDANQRKIAWLNLWQKTTAIYIPFGFLTMAVAPLLVKVLTAAKFHQVVSLIYFGSVFELCRQLSNIAYLAAHAEKKTTTTIKPYALGAISLFVLIFLLDINRDFLSSYSILFALVGAGFLTLIYNLFSVKKLLNISMDWKSPLKAILWSLPLLIFVYSFKIDQPTWILILASAFAGLYCLLIVSYVFVDFRYFLRKFLK